ncbi:unnamed protein product [Heligmosomoides polygyrus]|uniref:Variable outer membrane protein n=1 Tax=Heligmosomoides polygyrus TaxID=6339 RepID=A0A183FPM5_HELPZ|nr:unnamed protein product [Heligmosomoides polygyrus]
MARFCAVVLLLMVAPSCEDVDFDRVVREITGYKKGLLEQYLKEYSVLESRVNSLLYDGKKDGTKVDLLEYGNRVGGR